MVKRLPTVRETCVQSLVREEEEQDLLDKKMATHCSILVWKIPWTEKPGRLQSMGSQRVRQDWVTWLSLSFISLVVQMVKRLPIIRETWVQSWVGKISWRRKWQPIPVLLPGKSHGQRSLVGYSPWGCKESDMTERLYFLSFTHFISFSGMLLMFSILLHISLLCYFL